MTRHGGWPTARSEPSLRGWGEGLARGRKRGRGSLSPLVVVDSRHCCVDATRGLHRLGSPLACPVESPLFNPKQQFVVDDPLPSRHTGCGVVLQCTGRSTERVHRNANVLCARTTSVPEGHREDACGQRRQDALPPTRGPRATLGRRGLCCMQIVSFVNVREIQSRPRGSCPST